MLFVTTLGVRDDDVGGFYDIVGGGVEGAVDISVGLAGADDGFLEVLSYTMRMVLWPIVVTTMAVGEHKEVWGDELREMLCFGGSKSR